MSENCKGGFKMKTTKIELFGISFLYFILILLFVTFMFAYISPSKAVTITINDSNEANLELFFVFPIMFSLGTISLVKTWRRYYKDEN